MESGKEEKKRRAQKKNNVGPPKTPKKKKEESKLAGSLLDPEKIKKIEESADRCAEVQVQDYFTLKNQKIETSDKTLDEVKVLTRKQTTTILENYKVVFILIEMSHG
jgi:hypothetical protein